MAYRKSGTQDPGNLQVGHRDLKMSRWDKGPRTLKVGPGSRDPKIFKWHSGPRTPKVGPGPGIREPQSETWDPKCETKTSNVKLRLGLFCT